MATNPSSQSGGSNFANFIGQGIEALQDFASYGFDTLKDFAGSRLGQMIIGNHMKNAGVTDPQVSPMGYQGTVPYYTAVREAVPFTADPNRRAGSGGRRYFSDTQFIERPDADSGIKGGFAKYGYEEIDAEGNPSPGSGVFGAVQTTPDRNLTNLEAARRGAAGQALGLAAINLANPYGGMGTSPTPYPLGTDPYSMTSTRAGSGQVTGGIGGQTSATGGHGLINPGGKKAGGPTAPPTQGSQPDGSTAPPTQGSQPDGSTALVSPHDTIREYTADEGGKRWTDPNTGKEYYVDVTEHGKYDAERYQWKEVGTDEKIGDPWGEFTRGIYADMRPHDYNLFKGLDYDIPDSEEYAIGGGVKQLAGGRYLDGMTDGMADRVPSSIGGVQPAALSDGEFVIPADVVSHLGNGSSNAGAKVLDNMMTKVRTERTGNPKQGKEINPERVMRSAGIAGFANGGKIQKFQEGGSPDLKDDSGDDPNPMSNIGPESGYESSLANYAGQYVTDMLGKGRALAEMPYQAYGGPLTAGESDLQQQAFAGIGALDTPTGMGTGYDAPTFTAQDAQAGMSPFLQASLDPQIREARRQADISRVQNAARMAQAGSFGGSRQAILEAENLRNLGQQVGDITATGYQTAFEQARDQFNKDQDRLQQGRQLRDRFGLDVLQAQRDAGGIQRDIESEGVAADKAQFEEERAFPYKNVQYMQSLLQALPLTAVNRQYTEPSEMFKFLDAQGLLETDQAKQNLAAILGGLGGVGAGATDFITALGGGVTGILDYLGLGSGSSSGSGSGSS